MTTEKEPSLLPEALHNPRCGRKDLFDELPQIGTGGFAGLRLGTVQNLPPNRIPVQWRFCFRPTGL